MWRECDEKFNSDENDYRLGGKTVYGLANPNLVIDKIYDDLRNKKRVFITCERKKACEETCNNIKKKFPNANIIWITGDEERKQRYLDRHRARENWNDFMSAGSLSRWILWNRPTLRASISYYKKRFKFD